MCWWKKAYLQNSSAVVYVNIWGTWLDGFKMVPFFLRIFCFQDWSSRFCFIRNSCSAMDQSTESFCLPLPRFQLKQQFSAHLSMSCIDFCISLEYSFGFAVLCLPKRSLGNWSTADDRWTTHSLLPSQETSLQALSLLLHNSDSLPSSFSKHFFKWIRVVTREFFHAF